MKNKLKILFVGILLILMLSFFIFNAKLNLTGFVVSEDTEIANNITTITKEMALNAINESENTIGEMNKSGFATTYMEDALIEAKRVLQQAEYAAILRGEVKATTQDEAKARQALTLIKWKNLTYANVLAYTDDIQKRKADAFLISDTLGVAEKDLSSYSSEALQIFENAKMAFSEEKYEEAKKLLNDFRLQVEKERANASTLAGLQRGAMNFFQKYWIYVLVFLVLLYFLGKIVYKRFEKELLARKIRRMQIEKKVLDSLMKKAQTERYKENKISGLVYNIRMKKFNERIQEIKEELPVFEDKLKKLKN